jgi:hypothetical protein
LLKVRQSEFIVGKTREESSNKRQQLVTKDLTRCFFKVSGLTVWLSL